MFVPVYYSVLWLWWCAGPCGCGCGCGCRCDSHPTCKSAPTPTPTGYWWSGSDRVLFLVEMKLPLLTLEPSCPFLALGHLVCGAFECLLACPRRQASLTCQRKAQSGEGGRTMLRYLPFQLDRAPVRAVYRVGLVRLKDERPQLLAHCGPVRICACCKRSFRKVPECC